MDKSNNLRLVAIGASAGGLEPLQSFFAAMQTPPEDTAFVVIQHLSPDYKSMMGELLGRNTMLPIETVENGSRLKAGRVYLIPPKFNIFLRDKHTFGAAPKPSGVVNLPIDVFVSSAAGFYHEQMAVIILSGTGSDGVRGVVEANAAGGLALAQTPESAQFDGMPNSAISTGFIDNMGDPAELAAIVVRHFSHYSERVPLPDGGPGGTGAVKLRDVLHELRLRTGIPFDQYKQSTVARRVERRMALRQCTSLTAYMELLREQPEELDTLRRETLIGVTSFFRDPESFDALKESLIQLIEGKRSGQTLRIWVAGCSTGEEAYSIAMLADECISDSQKILELKIFATDLEQTYLDVATSGTYPESISSEVSAPRLKRYFSQVSDQLRIRPEIRKSIIFAKHNMISDAPFTKVDLVSCRNTLIYFETELQETVLRRFQYALGANGILFQGSSESLGRLQRDFTVVDSSARIFRALRPAVLSIEALQTDQKPDGMGRARTRGVTATRRNEGSIVELAEQALMSQLAPPALLLSTGREIMHIFGDITSFMKIPKGEATLDVSRMLETGAATALMELLKNDAEYREIRESAVLKVGGEDGSFFKLRLEPLIGPEGKGAYLLAFIPVEIAESSQAGSVPGESTDAKIEILQNELALTRQNLQNTIEELEASNEELQATNEELLASNEELQSTNEELQSVNEELYTVNSEYQEKIRILDRVNEDLDTMAQATGIPTLFLDENIHIVRFTPTITDIYQLRDSDIGRGLDEFSSKIGLDELPQLAQDALEAQKVVEKLRSSDSPESQMLVRIVPYSETAYSSRALVVMFINVTDPDKPRAGADVSA